MINRDPFGLGSLTDDLVVEPTLSASQVRQRGQTRRARRHVVAGIAAVVVLVAGAATAMNLGSSTTPDWATTTSPTPTPSVEASQQPPSSRPVETTQHVLPPQPTWDNVPQIEDLPSIEGVPWDVGDERESWGSDVIQTCLRSPLTTETVLVRDFVEPSGSWRLTAVTMGFDSTDAASTAHAALDDAYRSCSDVADSGLDDIEVWQEPGPIVIADEATAAAGDFAPLGATGMAVALYPGFGPDAVISAASVTQAGARLTWMISESAGMDYNCSLEANEHQEQCLVAALVNDVALRLVR